MVSLILLPIAYAYITAPPILRISWAFFAAALIINAGL